MLVSVVAAVSCASWGFPTADAQPCVGSKGVALIFSQEMADSFELLVKEPGESWSDIAAARRAAADIGVRPWLILHLLRADVDYAVCVEEAGAGGFEVFGKASGDFDAYLERGDIEQPHLNNFGLHDIY